MMPGNRCLNIFSGHQLALLWALLAADLVDPLI